MSKNGNQGAEDVTVSDSRPRSINVVFDQHLGTFKLVCVYGAAAAGLVFIARSLRLMATFRSAKSIPQEFVDKGFTLYGNVEKYSIVRSEKVLPANFSAKRESAMKSRAAPEALKRIVNKFSVQEKQEKPPDAAYGCLVFHVRHEPIIRTPRIFRALKNVAPRWLNADESVHAASDELLKVRVACVAVNDDEKTRSCVENEVGEHPVRYKLISRDGDVLDCLVMFQAGLFRWRNINERLVMNRLGYVLPYRLDLQHKVDYNSLYLRLLRTEKKADQSYIRSVRFTKISNVFSGFKGFFSRKK